MGLAGRKQKQRIPADPRNLSWADDASRFGLSYLSKFGWDASQGLGSSGEGMKTHIKVQQKLNMMGIGGGSNDIAWKQNKDFEALLKRLNESAVQGDGEDECAQETVMGDAFVRARLEKVEVDGSTTIKKRKPEDGGDSDARKKQKREKKKKEKRQKSSPDDTAIDPPLKLSPVPPSSKSRSEPIPKPRPMAHRARIRAAKRISGKSASAIAEILGIPPSDASTSTSTPALSPPPSDADTPQPSPSLDNLTTSTKSIADYFREKLVGQSSLTSSASSAASSGSATPGVGATTLKHEVTLLQRAQYL